MAHFAEIGSDGKVVRVIVVGNNRITKNCIEDEDLGKNYLEKYFKHRRFVQTSYNARKRKKYAAIGDSWDEVRGAFISPKPFSSWKLNEYSCQWEAPIPKPNYPAIWDEENQKWIRVFEGVI